MELNIEKRWLEQFGLAPVRTKDARINELLHICNHNYDIDCSYFTEMVRHIRWLEEELAEVKEENEKLKINWCPVDGMSCEYAKVHVECVVTDIECQHKNS